MWDAATDNVAVTGYDIYQGATLVSSSRDRLYTVSSLAPNTAYSFTVKARDAAGNVSTASTTLTVTTHPAIVIPADPASVAPPSDQTVASDIARDTAFLYSGPNPIQTGVLSGTIAVTRTAVLRGRVLTRDGGPLPGVTITILGHPEYG